MTGCNRGSPITNKVGNVGIVGIERTRAVISRACSGRECCRARDQRNFAGGRCQSNTARGIRCGKIRRTATARSFLKQKVLSGSDRARGEVRFIRAKVAGSIGAGVLN